MTTDDAAVIADDDAERSVLGACLMSPPALEECVGLLDPEDFAAPAHAELFTAMRSMRTEGEPVDPITVNDWMAKRGLQRNSRGLAYPHTLVSAVPTAANAGYYARLVADKAALRRLDQVLHRARLRVQSAGDYSAADVAEQVRGDVAMAVHTPDDAEVQEWFGPASESAFDPTLDRATSTGLIDLDRQLGGGFRPGELIIVAARPGGFKSVATLGFCREVSIRQRRPSVLASLEMTRHEIRQRMLAAEYALDLSQVRTGTVPSTERHRLLADAHDVGNAPLFIDERAYRLPRLLASIRRHHARSPLALAVVDYVQLVRVDTRNATRQQQVGEVSRALKELALDLDIPVIAAAQLNRNAEGRRPSLADLRESGDLEQDPDVVVLLSRPDDSDDLVMDVAKNRNGDVGAIVVHPQGSHARLANATVWRRS